MPQNLDYLISFFARCTPAGSRSAVRPGEPVTSASCVLDDCNPATILTTTDAAEASASSSGPFCQGTAAR